jgi:hypothetical protein
MTNWLCTPQPLGTIIWMARQLPNLLHKSVVVLGQGQNGVLPSAAAAVRFKGGCDILTVLCVCVCACGLGEPAGQIATNLMASMGARQVIGMDSVPGNPGLLVG